MSKLSDNHYTVLRYVQRCTKVEAQDILLNHDMVIHFGRVYKLKCKSVGAGIYEISKDLEEYQERNNSPKKSNLSQALKSVLCSPDGKVCIKGSDGDRKILQEVITHLEGEGR